MPNWILQDKPQIKKHTNMLNEHVLHGMESADICVKWLKAQGFTVVNVLVGRRNPRIEIQNSQLCHALEGAVYIAERTSQGAKRGWVAIRHGCEVRWTETGGAA